MRWFVTLILASLILAGCAGNTTSPTSVPQETAQTAPGETVVATTLPNEGYPVPGEEYPPPPLELFPYPAPTEELAQGPAFTINTPVRAADTQVTGTGPAGVPIRLIDIARSAQVLGETVINADGTFSIDVGNELIAGNRIALVLGDTSGTNVNPADFVRGENYEDIPLIGITFFQTVVQE